MRGIIFLLLCLLAPFQVAAQTDAGCRAPAATGDGWDVMAPVNAGFDPTTLCAIGPRFSAWTEANVHAVLVIRHDNLVFEHYFTGVDQPIGQPGGTIAFDAATKHDLRSITKSVTALVLGIAVGKGQIASVDQPVLPLFPRYADLRSPEKDKITLRHLLTMSQGLEWNEDLPYSNPANSEIKMNHAPDPVRYALEQPAVTEPGVVYNYSGGSAAIIAALLRKATGQGLDTLARHELFEPLGITDFEWISYPSGDPVAASGLKMRPRDLVKIGQLVLNHGVWHSQQVVPADWISAATSPQINGRELYFYGYQFWLGRSLVKGQEVDWIAGVGYGGQRLFVVPSLDIVVLVYAGLYNSSMQAWVPLVILNRYVLAAADRP